MTTLSRDTTVHATVREVPMPAAERWDADEAVTQMYAAHYASLVRLAALLVRDSGEAEEIVQDAFVRAIGRWSVVCAYDNPEAWLRKVALGLLSNRRRELRRGVRALRRLGVPPDVPTLDGDAVDLDRALRRLPLRQREVLVLAYVAGLDLTAIARELDVPVGTVEVPAQPGTRRDGAPAA